MWKACRFPDLKSDRPGGRALVAGLGMAWLPLGLPRIPKNPFNFPRIPKNPKNPESVQWLDWPGPLVAGVALLLSRLPAAAMGGHGPLSALMEGGASAQWLEQL